MCSMERAVIPAGVSAIFEPFICSDPFLSGARGSGIGVEEAVEVSLSISKSDRLAVTNYINGEPARDGLGIIAVKTFFEILGIEPKYHIEINQKINVPIGCGFGTSAASALGIVLLLSRTLKLPLSLIQIGDIAHIAEIRARTGLGTVSGLVFLGDIVIVARPGAPSNCLVDRILLGCGDIYVVLASRGKKETAIALSDSGLIEKASTYGKIAVDKLIKDPTPENFFQISRSFARKTGLLVRDIDRLIDKLKGTVIGAAQAMIGDSIFALAYREDIDEARKIIEDSLGAKAFVGRLVRSGFCTS